LSAEFLLTTFIIVATPGTGVIFTLAAGLSRGARASVIAAVGCTLGIVPHMLAAVLGLAALLNASAVAFQALKYLGVAYLIFLAWRTLRETGGLTMATTTAPPSTLRVIGSAILVNLLNPKLTLFFFAFLPQFVNTTESSAVPRMLELSGVFMLVTLGVFVCYGVLAASLRERVMTRPAVLTWMRRSFAGAFLVLGARLALADRQ